MCYQAKDDVKALFNSLPESERATILGSKNNAKAPGHNGTVKGIPGLGVLNFRRTTKILPQADIIDLSDSGPGTNPGQTSHVKTATSTSASEMPDVEVRVVSVSFSQVVNAAFRGHRIRNQ